MGKSEDGEFELILGNRQLLSVFFIVVVLLGVFFTMGYIVGRSSSPTVSADAGRKTEPKPISVERAATASASPSLAADTPPPLAAPPTERPAPVPHAKTSQPLHAQAKPEAASPTPDVPTPGASYLQIV